MPASESGSRFRRRLTDSEVGRITAASQSHGSEAGFKMLWCILLGIPLEEAATAQDAPFEVRDYAIPADQDRQIQRILSVPPSRKTRKRWSRRDTGMAFLFYGPATYDEAEPS